MPSLLTPRIASRLVGFCQCLVFPPKQLQFGSAAGGAVGKTGAVVLSLPDPREQERREARFRAQTMGNRVPSVFTDSLPDRYRRHT